MTEPFDPDRPVSAYVRHLYADRSDPACRGRYIRVGIYPTADALRAAASRYHVRRGDVPEADAFEDTLGVFQPRRFTTRYDRKRRAWVDTTAACAGVLRLCREALTPNVVTHEATHAALHITRLHDWAKPDTDGRADFGDNCDEAEEAFAYLLGDLTGVLFGMVADYQARLP